MLHYTRPQFVPGCHLRSIPHRFVVKLSTNMQKMLSQLLSDTQVVRIH
jgi:hypothetical protein